MKWPLACGFSHGLRVKTLIFIVVPKGLFDSCPHLPALFFDNVQYLAPAFGEGALK